MHFNIPVKIIILNNNFLGMVRQWQEMFYKSRYSSTELHNPDFLTIAKGYNIPARKVSDRKELRDSLKEMLKADGPFILEISIDNEGNILPMVEPGASVSEVTLTYKQ